MVGVSLTTREKQVCPKLHLHLSPSRLNQSIIETHQQIMRQEREQKKKTGKKEFLKQFTKDINKHIKKAGIHADTTTLRLILKLLPEEKKNIKEIGKMCGIQYRIAIDGCEFLKQFGLIKGRGMRQYSI